LCSCNMFLMKYVAALKKTRIIQNCLGYTVKSLNSGKESSHIFLQR
jgi:hypothetical protein